jgi:glutamyl-tRNA synthetase
MKEEEKGKKILSGVDVRAEIRKYALQNAIRYEKEPKAESVLKKLLGEHPELRKEAKKISLLVEKETKSIGSMRQEERIEELKKSAPELMEEVKPRVKVKAKEEIGLPELPHAKEKEVVMRFAPNPNGPPTLGSARGVIINSEYAKRYDGKFILRFDDTDPVLKKPLIEAYDWWLEDCIWLDANPDEVLAASDRMDLYYRYAEEVIKKGAAYVCQH